MLTDLISGQSFLAYARGYVAGGFVWRQGATRAAQTSVGAAKTRATCARQMSATQAKRFFFLEEDLGTGYFTTSFPVFQGSCHNSKLTDKKKKEIKREVKPAAKIQNCTRITQYTRTIDYNQYNPFVMRSMISFAYVSENYQPPFASRFC